MSWEWVVVAVAIITSVTIYMALSIWSGTSVVAHLRYWTCRQTYDGDIRHIREASGPDPYVVQQMVLENPPRKQQQEEGPSHS